jgi:hypothetical protein
MRYWGMLGGAAALAVLVIGTFAGSGAANHAGSQTLTFTQAPRGDLFRFIDERPRSRGSRNKPTISSGDELVLGFTLRTQAGERAGRIEAACTALRGARRFDRARWGCQGFARLADGTLSLALTFRFRDNVVIGTVTGGTGAYEGASGSFRLTTQEPNIYTFHIATPGF